METHDKRRLEYYANRIEELRLWRNAREHRIEKWRFDAGAGEPQKLALGDFWPEVPPQARLSAQAKIPEDWTGQRVELELWLGGEGFVRLSNGVTSGLNPFHRRFPVADKAWGGETVEIEAEVVAKGLFGSHVAEPRLTHAMLVVPEAEVQALERDTSMIFEACTELDDHEIVTHLLDALGATFATLGGKWPSESSVVVARYLRGYVNPLGEGLYSIPPAVGAGKVLDVNWVGQALWNIPDTTGPLDPLPERAREAVGEAKMILASQLKEIGREYSPAGRLALTGHAHLDLAWLWPLAETRRKARRTFSSVLNLMERYTDFTFNQSSAQLYAWIEEDDPQLFERIRERVREGRWELVGGSWTEPDCQITGGESFVRQLFYGQQYFEEEFGLRSSVAWLPDAFGFSPAIPQLLRGAGMTGFFTAKLKWNEANAFPHDLFEWEGIDGSRVKAHTTQNPGLDYNGDIVPSDLLGTWRHYKGKRHHPESLFPFGWGDGGGGPSEKMLENYARLKGFPQLPRLRMARVADFFASLPEEGLPVWVGELYLELHRGTLTTHSRVKHLNRVTEHRLLEAEVFSVLAALRGATYPLEVLEEAWKTLLLNQFHDILPGSSISEVYEDAHRQLEETMKRAERVRDGALRHLAGLVENDAERTVLVANAALHARPLSVLLSEEDPGSIATVTDSEGKPLPIQTTAEGLLVHAPQRRVPGLGWSTLRINRGTFSSASWEGAQEDVRAGKVGEGAFLENEFLQVDVGSDGSLHQVYDRQEERELLNGRGNQLWAYVDKPPAWDAWDLNENYEIEGAEITDAESVEIVERGPLRAAVRVMRRWRGSQIAQTYRLLAASRRLDIVTQVVWHERQIILRALFPLNVRSHEATFETMYGSVKRPTHRNTSWDAARFEVSAHRFCDLSEPGYGVALLNDGKYGHSVEGGVLGISLLRSPLYPDPFADEGEHRCFTYSLLPHPSDLSEAKVIEEAFALNSPLYATGGEEGKLSSEYSLLAAEGVTLALGSLKKAEDGRGIVLRLYEPHGARGSARLRFANEIESAERVNLLEEPEKPAEVRGSEIHLEVRPFEVLTLRIELRNG